MMWEIRNDVDTFCIMGSGATRPWDMIGAAKYLAPRTGATIQTSFNSLGFPVTWVRDSVINSIVNARTPAVIGTGFFQHYPLAIGYRVRTRIRHFLWWQRTDTERQFNANWGWSGSNGDGWIPARTWFSGRLFAN